MAMVAMAVMKYIATGKPVIELVQTPKSFNQAASK
jgi:hypothetical protein